MQKYQFVCTCDDCGKPMPKKYIRKGPDAEFFDHDAYNQIVVVAGRDSNTVVQLPLSVNIEYASTLRELCPECRVKWLKKALLVLEADLLREEEK